ncbi:MAG TPA: class I SAM-dependent methyltransferase [Firmicutes bacterium]|nr:class I SAM-dependent methyltransferase [Bacillota bacterium]
MVTEPEIDHNPHQKPEGWWQPVIRRGSQDFARQFQDWAAHYDDTVWQAQGRFADVFEGYGRILARTADLVGMERGSLVVDVGAGTGNLTIELVRRGYRVIAVEPSPAMREVFRRKLPDTPVEDGTFLELPLADATVDAVVSSYAFHHLTDAEKFHGILEMLRVLKPEGRLVMTDIVFLSDEVRRHRYYELGRQGRADFVAELEAEPYATVLLLDDLFRRAGCVTRWEQLSPWVWTAVAHLASRTDSSLQPAEQKSKEAGGKALAILRNQPADGALPVGESLENQAVSGEGEDHLIPFAQHGPGLGPYLGLGGGEEGFEFGRNSVEGYLVGRQFTGE